MQTTNTNAAEIAERTGADPGAVEAIIAGCAEIIPEMRERLVELTEWMERVERVLHIDTDLEVFQYNFEDWKSRSHLVEVETGREEANDLLGDIVNVLDIWHR